MESKESEQVPTMRNAYDGSPYETHDTKEAVLEELNKELNKVLDDAYKDGVITPDEEAAAQAIVEKIDAIKASESVVENADADTLFASLYTLSVSDLPVVV